MGSECSSRFMCGCRDCVSAAGWPTEYNSPALGAIARELWEGVRDAAEMEPLPLEETAAERE